jgi:hypothetical protein
VSWDRELRVLNEAIRRCNAEYDAFLFGSVGKPPVESRRHVEEMFRRLARDPSDAAADRYQLSTLQGRFSSLCERWERLQAEKEAGRRPGVHGGFSSPPAAEPAASHPNAPAPGSVEANREAGGPLPRDRELFERYVAARRDRGEKVESLRFESFLERLAEEREKLRSRLGVTEVDFDVVLRDGRVKLVAKPHVGRKSPVRGPR